MPSGFIFQGLVNIPVHIIRIYHHILFCVLANTQKLQTCHFLNSFNKTSSTGLSVSSLPLKSSCLLPNRHMTHARETEQPRGKRSSTALPVDRGGKEEKNRGGALWVKYADWLAGQVHPQKYPGITQRLHLPRFAFKT